MSARPGESASTLIAKISRTPVISFIPQTTVVKTSHMSPVMQEFAIVSAQDAIANFTTENEIAASIKKKFEEQFPST
jgi:hypothetical protein